MKSMDEIREEYGEEETNATTMVIGMVLTRVQGMCDHTAAILEEMGDKHGAMVMRIFKESLGKSWNKAITKEEKMQ